MKICIVILICLLRPTLTDRARAKGAIALVADVVAKSPANNDFIYMIEHGMMDAGIVSLVEGMASKYAATTACQKFKSMNFNNIGVGPIGRRQVSDDNGLANEMLSILNTAEGKLMIDKVANGKVLTVPPPKFKSGGFGKRADDLSQQELLNVLNSAEGKEIIMNEINGKGFVPPPKYRSGGLGFFKRMLREKRQTQKTHHINIQTGQGLSGGATKPATLMARVRNVIVNKYSLKLFLAAYDDGTMRSAMYNICRCNAIASNIRYFFNLGR